jgi:hypothetical protein
MHIMQSLRRAIVLVAERLGEDGLGRDGSIGYFRRLAIKEPDEVAALISHILPLESKVPMKETDVEYTNVDQIREALCRGGMPDDLATREANLVWGSRPKSPYRDATIEKTEGREMAGDLREAILIALEQVGEDGRGRNGVVGFFYRLSIKHPRAYARLFCRAAPLEMAGSTEPAEEPKYRTVEEIREDLHKRGLPDSAFYDLEYHDQEQVHQLLAQKREPNRH